MRYRRRASDRDEHDIIRFIPERAHADQYDTTKRARIVCSAAYCEQPAIVELVRPHAKHGQWVRALCEEHVVMWRRR